MATEKKHLILMYIQKFHINSFKQQDIQSYPSRGVSVLHVVETHQQSLASTKFIKAYYNC